MWSRRVAAVDGGRWWKTIWNIYWKISPDYFPQLMFLFVLFFYYYIFINLFLQHMNFIFYFNQYFDMAQFSDRPTTIISFNIISHTRAPIPPPQSPGSQQVRAKLAPVTHIYDTVDDTTLSNVQHTLYRIYPIWMIHTHPHSHQNRLNIHTHQWLIDHLWMPLKSYVINLTWPDTITQNQLWMTPTEWKSYLRLQLYVNITTHIHNGDKYIYTLMTSDKISTHTETLSSKN